VALPQALRGALALTLRVCEGVVTLALAPPEPAAAAAPAPVA
jgi:hypothetical protein